MRLLSVVLQNKKGENIVIATSPSLLTRTCILYSNFIYEHILETYRRRLKIQRTLTLEPGLNCVLSINKDYILYIFVPKNDLSLAFDAVKKVNEFFTGSAKMFAGASSQTRLEIVSKKFVQFMSVMEEFLYTREIGIREYLLLMPPAASKKRSVDSEIFNKFSHITVENDRKIIQDAHILSSGIQGLEVKRKSKMIDQAKKLIIKSQDELDLLEADPEKENYINNYRKHIIRFALCGRRRLPATTGTLSEINLSNVEPPEELLEEHQIEESIIEKQRMRIRMNEKLQLSLQNAKIKQVLQYGQIVVEGTQKETAIVKLCGSEGTWNNSKLINKRITPISLGTTTDMGEEVKFTTEANFKSKPVIDYIMRKQSFTPQKIPLLFVYSREVSSSNIQFTFKYKINQRWKHRLYDVDISVFLSKEFMVMDCKSVPSAYSLKNNKITWKTKEIMPNSHNSKGKIILAFGASNIAPKHIIREIKLTMKANCGLIEQLRSQCHQDCGHVTEAEKMLLIQYKISPNDEPRQSK